MNRAERKRQAKDDDKLLQRGIDPETNDPAPTAAMARQMYAPFEKAKCSGSIEPAVKFLYAKAAATQAAKPTQVACARGCAHCCNGWVSVTAPEILFAARQVRERGEALMSRVRAAAETVQAYDMAERPNHPNPCPMLEDNACGLYEARPFACRMAVVRRCRCLRAGVPIVRGRYDPIAAAAHPDARILSTRHDDRAEPRRPAAPLLRFHRRPGAGLVAR